MQATPQTSPRTNTTQNVPKAVTAVEKPVIQPPVKIDASQESALARLLASCCDCV